MLPGLQQTVILMLLSPMSSKTFNQLMKQRKKPPVRSMHTSLTTFTATWMSYFHMSTPVPLVLRKTISSLKLLTLGVISSQMS